MLSEEDLPSQVLNRLHLFNIREVGRFLELARREFQTLQRMLGLPEDKLQYYANFVRDRHPEVAIEDEGDDLNVNTSGVFAEDLEQYDERLRKSLQSYNQSHQIEEN